jgi:hypothetical protein
LNRFSGLSTPHLSGGIGFTSPANPGMSNAVAQQLRKRESRLRRDAHIRDTIFEELQKRAPHPLPEYTRSIKDLKS